MKHLKPYNKIYNMMCGVASYFCVWACTRVRLVWDYRVLSLRV